MRSIVSMRYMAFVQVPHAKQSDANETGVRPVILIELSAQLLVTKDS